MKRWERATWSHKSIPVKNSLFKKVNAKIKINKPQSQHAKRNYREEAFEEKLPEKDQRIFQALAKEKLIGDIVKIWKPMFQNLFVSFDHSFRYTSTVSDDDSAPISHVTIGKKSYSEGVISFVLHFRIQVIRI